MSRRRSAWTLAETLVAVGIFSLVLTLVLLLWRQSEFEGRHVEESSDLLRQALLLRTSLELDLRHSLPDSVLGISRSETSTQEIVLPGFSGYFGSEPVPLRARAKSYRFDPASGSLWRGNEVFLVGLESLRFRFTPEPSPGLEVELQALAREGGGVEEIHFVVVDPRSLPSLGWKVSERHSQALLEDLD